MFSLLDAGDFANCKHKARRSKDSIREMTNFSNKTSYVVANDILKGENVGARGGKIDEWIRIASRLLSSRDYHSAQGVIGGLTQSCIFRLKKSWEYATEGPRLKLVKDRLTNKNYADQRGALLKSFNKEDDAYKHMVIPFLGMILKDLEKVDQMPNQNQNGSVNQWKYHLVAKCVSKVISQKEFHVRKTTKNSKIDNEMEAYYEEAEDNDRKHGRFETLDDIADEYVKIERGKMLCNQSVRSKLVTVTFLNVITWSLLWGMFSVYIEKQKEAYMILHLTWFCAANLISCWVTRYTTFVSEEEESLDTPRRQTFEHNQEKKCCTGERVVSYLFDAVGLGILPAFWRAWKVNMMHENIFGEIDSWKKEFSRQNAVSGIALHLPLVAVFLYTNFRSMEILKIFNVLVLFFPLVSISFIIFLLFRGAHETTFLVSGRTIVVAGFISLFTDFLLRAVSLIALLAYFLRAADCIDDNNVCIEELIKYGEDFCNVTSISSSIIDDDCCECDGGSNATDSESFMFKVYAGITAAMIFVYEFAWVLLFHYNYNKKEEKRGRVSDQDISHWNSFLTKVLQALLLSQTFTIINIPILGMYRPEYRKYEHYIRILIAIGMGIIFMKGDTIIDDFSLQVAMAIVIPVHVIAYLIFERAMSQQEGQDQLSMPDYFKGASSMFDKFKTDRLSVMPWRGKQLVGTSTSEDIHLPNLVLLGESTADLTLSITGSKQSAEDNGEVELQAAVTKAQVV